MELAFMPAITRAASTRMPSLENGIAAKTPHSFRSTLEKAIPTGGRKGNVDPEVSSKGTALFSRLEEHRKSIEQASNLDIRDFSCRYLVVDDIWIPLGESLLIQRHRPIWNSAIDGFGNHDPGAGRIMGARPSWDALHPGRKWAERCAPSKLNESQIREHIRKYWAGYDGFREHEQ
jgi:hypothetical protein